MIENDTQQRVAREAHAHDSDNVLENSYKLKNRFSHIWNYPSRQDMNAYIDSVISCMRGKYVLDYGCGWGDESFKYLEAGAKVSGIDISAKHIESAELRAKSLNINEHQYSFNVMDAHKLQFDADVFDYVIGYGILHHLNQDVALSEIYRVLSSGGEAIFFEPLADNPLLKLFRFLTPSARTEDEAPLSAADLMRYKSLFPWDIRFVYCGLIEAPLAMVTSLLIPDMPDNPLLRLGGRIERWLRRKHILDSWNQYVLIVIRKR